MPQRRKYFVDREVQGGLLGKAAGYWLLSLAVVGALNVIGWIFIAPGADVLVKMRDQLPSFFGVLIVALLSSLIVLPVLLYDLAKYSNRFAGPVYRLQRNLNALAEGQPVAPMSFRENDYWQALAESFNKVASRLAATEQAAASRHEDDFQPCLAADFQDSLPN